MNQASEPVSQALDSSSQLEPIPVHVPSDQSAGSQDNHVQSTFSDKTDRIRVLTQFIKAITPILFGIVIVLVLMPLIGKLLLTNVVPSEIAGANLSSPSNNTVVIEQPISLSKLDQAIADAVQKARIDARTYAETELNQWESELVPRVDNFLDWYFDYFNQKGTEFKTPLIWASSYIWKFVDKDSQVGNDAVVAHITEETQKEFSKRVLMPQSAQLRFKLLTTKTVETYLNSLGQELANVRIKLKVSQAAWEKYLKDLSVTVVDAEGSISHLSLNFLVGKTAFLAGKAGVVGITSLSGMTMSKLGSKPMAKLAGKAVAKTAGKAGASVAAELGTTLLGPLVDIGILAWDYWDYKNTVSHDKPVLREALITYLHDMKRDLLDDPQAGVMSALYQIENEISAKLSQPNKAKGTA